MEGAIVWSATRATISLAVWSAVALLSIPSNFVPSVAISLPSTVPDTVMFPVTSRPAFASRFTFISTALLVIVILLDALVVSLNLNVPSALPI